MNEDILKRLGEVAQRIYDPDAIKASKEDINRMRREDLYQRMQELSAQCAAMREALEEIVRTEPDEKPDGTILGCLVHDAYEMCGIANAALKHDAGRALLNRLRKLELSLIHI